MQVEFSYFSSIFPPRCDLCALSGEDLEKNEELRRRLMNLEKEAANLFGRGMKLQGLRKIEQKMEIMEKNWDEFGLLVRPHHRNLWL